jgi:hypothetical protein
MTLTISLKRVREKGAIESSLSSSSTAPSQSLSSEPPHSTKRGTVNISDRISCLIFHLAKRAETRQCPVCDEHIPLRLLSRHAELESERVEDVIRKIGSSDITYDELDDRYIFNPPLSLSHTYRYLNHILDLDPVPMSVVRL